MSLESESRPKSTTGGQKSLANACQHRRGSGNRDTRLQHTHAVPKVPNAHRNCTGGPTQAWSPNLGRGTCLTRHTSRPRPASGHQSLANACQHTNAKRGPSYRSKGLHQRLKPIPRTTPGSATTTGWRGCCNTEPDPICQLDRTLAQQASTTACPHKSKSVHR